MKIEDCRKQHAQIFTARVIVILAILIGLELFGLLGIIIAVPVATIAAFIDAIIAAHVTGSIPISG